MLANDTDYIELLEQIKREIAQTRSQVAAQAGASVIGMYWRIGHHLNEGASMAPAISTLFPRTSVRHSQESRV